MTSKESRFGNEEKAYLRRLVEEKLERGVGKVSADELQNRAYPEKYGAEGDGSTDDRQAIQDLFSNHAAVAFKPDKTYFVDVAANGPIGLPSDRDVYLPETTTILGNVETMTNPIVIENENASGSTQDTNISIWGGGTIDGGFTPTAEEATGSGGVLQFHNVEGLRLEGITAQNGRMMCISKTWVKNARLINCTFKNAGNDTASLSDGSVETYPDSEGSVSENVRYINCEAAGAYDGGFEVDDGPTDVWYINCDSETADSGNKPFDTHSHPDAAHTSNIHWVNCTAKQTVSGGDTSPAYKLGPFAGSGVDSTVPEGFYFDGCDYLGGSGGVGIGSLDLGRDVYDVTIRGGTLTGNYAILFETDSGGLYDLEIDGTTVEDTTSGAGVLLKENGFDFKNFSVSGVKGRNVGGGGSGYNDAVVAVWSAGAASMANGSVRGVTADADCPVGIYHDGEDYVSFVSNVLRDATTPFSGAIGTNSQKSANIT